MAENQRTVAATMGPRWWSWRHRRPVVADSLSVLRHRVREVQIAAADLVSNDTVDEMLARIVDRAGSVVIAPGYLLVLCADEGRPPVVHQRGISPERAAVLAERMLCPGDIGVEAVIVDIVSTRKMHGYLAAVFPEMHTAMDGDRLLLEAYAAHAAAALDLVTALEQSRREAARSAALLGLAHELAISDSIEAVAGVVSAALPIIVGCEGASVLLWNAERGELRPIASEGLECAEQALYLQSTILVGETPELIGLLTRREPVVVTAESASPGLSKLCRDIGTHSVVAVPLLAGDVFMGVATVSWNGPVAACTVAEAVARVQGASYQCATAMQKARLLSTVRHQSQHDALTGLSNRVSFARELDTALLAAAADSVTAIVFCDLDDFKRVNESLGHPAGDDLLRQVAARLGALVGPADNIGRLGGDEFVIVLRDTPGAQSAIDHAHRVVECLNRAFRVGGRDLRMSVSVGVSVHTGGGGQGVTLVTEAERAMFSAKRAGPNQVAVAGQPHRPDRHDSLASELAVALAADEMRLYFQPVVDITDIDAARVVGAEVLIRWLHPRLGVLVPAAFLPLAQEVGLMADLDLWAVGAACAAAAAWPRSDGAALTVAVNLDAATLVDDRLFSTVRGALMCHKLPPAQLLLEVVESRALIDLPGIVERLVDLRRLGVRISLDDFGTGYSTLSWLGALPVDQIKIDRSFVMNLPEEDSTTLVQGILALTTRLDVEVIAEGVETVEQLTVLRSSGCALVQGYLFGRPEPALVLQVPNPSLRDASVAV